MLPLISGSSGVSYVLLTAFPRKATKASLERAEPAHYMDVARPETGRATVTLGRVYLPALRRWTRVRRSSLRCFFFDMRLRRFLITEPMGAP